MKNNIQKAIPFLFIFFSLSLIAQNDIDEPIRMQRKNVITAEAGFKSLSGVGINYTRQVNERLGVDVGAGFGTQILRWGVRGRYFLSKRNFSPFVGAGLVLVPLQVDGVNLYDEFETETVNINRTVNMQLVGGLEFMSKGGFTISANLGYQLPITKPYTTITDITDESKFALDLLYGKGLLIAGNIGYSF
ncbi:hypothetical protein [Portibacter lacus]|uniref:Outer membrane protein beta-barrel domain-containing protein n=1 Tax=Portibacter lacus TaxID=1099794 RepID=A0AA37SS28_9BACT|nr:hypothetical protein [Portibacter lacus]GLR18745.1 hypothetical protein GCM10007940_33610 [Portibacter lacus]